MPESVEPSSIDREHDDSDDWADSPLQDHEAWRGKWLETKDSSNTCTGIGTPDSQYIDREYLFQVYEAIRFANYNGAVFNVQLTISFELAGFTKQSAIDEAFQRMSDRYRKYAAHRKCPAYYYAVFESSRDAGCHCHMGLHVPYYLKSDFKKWLDRTLYAGFDGISLKGFYMCAHNKNSHICGQWIWFQYCMKGVNPKLSKSELRNEYGHVSVHECAGLRFRSRPVGELKIDRVRISRSLRKKARDEARYVMADGLCELEGRRRWDDSEYRRGIADRLWTEMSRARYEVVP